MNRFLPAWLAIFAMLSLALFLLFNSSPSLPQLPQICGYNLFWPPTFAEDEVQRAPTLSGQPGHAPLYRAVTPLLDEDGARELAAKFGFEGKLESGEQIEESPFTDAFPGSSRPSLEAEDEHGEFRALLDAWAEFTSSSAANYEVASDEITEEQAQSAAVAFLSEQDLLPKGAEVCGVSSDSVDGLTTVKFSDKRLKCTPPYRECFFTPNILVAVSSSGSVGNVQMTWFDLETVGAYPIVSEQEAYRRIFEGLGSPSVALTLAEGIEVEITGVTLTYGTAAENRWDDWRFVGPLYFVPLYRFYTTVDNGWIDVLAFTDEYLFPPGVEWPPDKGE